MTDFNISDKSDTNKELASNQESIVSPEEEVDVNGKKRRRKKIAGSRIEEHVGKKIKLFRQMLGMSQANIADHLDVTFQQFKSMKPERIESLFLN